MAGRKDQTNPAPAGPSHSRRMLLAGGTSALAVLTAEALAGVTPAQANNGDAVLQGTDNSSPTARTAVIDSSGNVGALADPSRNVGVYGNGVNFGVLGDTSGVPGIGVLGTSGTSGIGVQGEGAGEGAGVTGFGGDNGGTGVYGHGGLNSGDGMTCIAGAPSGRGVAGFGANAGEGVAGFGGDASGTGVTGTGGGNGGDGVTGTGNSLDGRGVVGTGGGAGEGVSGFGGSSGGDGVSGIGASPHGRGLVGTGGGGEGVSGLGGGAAGTGVTGFGGGEGGTGVHGIGTVTGAGVVGTGHGAATSATGVGVLAENAFGGAALQANGPAVFSRSGILTVAAGKSSGTVTAVALSAASLVLATLQQNLSGVWVRSAVPNVSRSSFTVHLSKAVSASTSVAWFVVN